MVQLQAMTMKSLVLCMYLLVAATTRRSLILARSWFTRCGLVRAGAGPESFAQGSVRVTKHKFVHAHVADLARPVAGKVC